MTFSIQKIPMDIDINGGFKRHFQFWLIKLYYNSNIEKYPAKQP